MLAVGEIRWLLLCDSLKLSLNYYRKGVEEGPAVADDRAGCPRIFMYLHGEVKIRPWCCVMAEVVSKVCALLPC